MNCQYCGKKIGILENWRYGRFCSKEHQDEFREEANRLAASALGSQVGTTATSQGRTGGNLSIFAQPAPGAAGEPGELPDPPMMAAVGQDQPAAVRCKPPELPPIPPPAPCERDQRCLKILAAIDRMPPALEKDSRRRLNLEDAPFRFGPVMASGTRRILVPPSGAVQKRPKLNLFDSLLPLRYDETGGPLPEFEPAWQSEAAWGADDAEPVAMDFGQHLEDYSPEQPWQDWDWDALLEEAKYFQAMAEQREKQRGELRSHKAQERATEGSASQQQRRPGYPAMPGGPTPGRTPTPAAMPALSLASAGLTGQPSPQRSSQHAHSAPAPHAGGPGGMFLPAMPAYPGLTTLRPVSPGSAGAPGGGRRSMPAARQQAGRGGPARGDYVQTEWVELAPPLFMALCKIDDPAAVRANTQPARPPCRAIEAAAEPIAPAGVRTIVVAAARMQLGPQRLYPVAVAQPAAPEPLRLAPPAASLPAVAACSIPHRRPDRLRLALPPRPAQQRVVLDLRPLPAIARPHLYSRVVG